MKTRKARITYLKVLLSLLLCLPMTTHATAKTVSDSLVEDLSCEQITHDHILKKIRPEAFRTGYHLPIQNWAFSAGLFDLAACWSLAHTQRLFFYLGRYGEIDPVNADKMVFDLMEMIRGSSPVSAGEETMINEFPLQKLPVFAQAESSMGLQNPLWSQVLLGFKQSLSSSQQLLRNFRTEVEFYQNRRFHDFARNAKYAVGNGARTVAENRETRKQLLQNLEANKLTLLLLRPKRMSQHVVLAKHFEIKSNGDVEIQVYDSNSPFSDRIVTYSKQEGHFYAPDIVRGLPQVPDPQIPLGVFIVDEKDRDFIGKTLVQYYRKKCR